MDRKQRQRFQQLIRQRAETSGVLLRKEKSWDQRGLGSIRAKLARIDAEIVSMNPEIDVHDIRSLRHPLPVNTTDTRGFSDKLLALMIETDGQPISTMELREKLQARLSLPSETAEQRKYISIMISRRLIAWERKGAVQRIRREGAGRSNGLWVWVGL